MKESDNYFEENEINNIINIENSDNIDIKNNIRIHNKEENEEKDYNNNNQNLQLNHSVIIKEVIDNLLKNSKEMSIQSEYKINLLLMSSYENIDIKTLYYNLIFLFNIIKKKFPIIKYIINKINNFYEKNKEINIKIVINMLYLYGKNLFEQKRYFYSYNFLRKAKNILRNIPLEKELEEINSIYFKVLEKINIHIKSKYELFKNRNKISENKLILINKALDKILIQNVNIQNDINNIINNDEIEENDSYLYIISKNWVFKAKIFITNLNVSLKNEEKEDSFLENSFNEDYVLYSYFEDLNESKNSDNSIYPGPINNYNLLEYKDFWEDPINEEENIFIKKNYKLNKDYFLINENEWKMLNDIFDSSNELKIKRNKIKENVEFIKLKALILDKRLGKNILLNSLKRRIIQIKNNYDIKQLKEKIIRCISYELKKVKKDKLGFFDKDDEEEMNEHTKRLYQTSNIYFYIIDKKNKNILVEICTAFTNKINFYNSTLLKEVSLKEEEPINKLLNIYNKKEHILIIEINDKNFLRQIKPIENNLIYKCDICNNKVNEQNKYKCGKCNISILCSEKCFKKSENHKSFHNYFVPLLKPNFNYKMLEEKKIDFKENSRKGHVVLFNLGNTCYLNSTIQCLSNTIDLTKYFLFDIYKNEQNFIKYNTSAGNIVEEFASLIKELWIGKQKIVSPVIFKSVFSKTTQKFLGNYKYPPYDFLESLLSCLHDKLNRAYLKSNVVKKEEEIIDKENLYEKSKIYENNEKLKNDSIIYDLFNGLIINTKICQMCKNKSTKFENFNILNLPIPKNQCSLSIKYFDEKEYKCFPFSVNENTTFGDLKEKALSFYQDELIKEILKNNDDFFNKVIYIDDNLINYNGYKIPKILLYDYLEIIILNSKKIIIKNKKIKDYEKILSFLDKGIKEYEIVLYQKRTISDKFINIFISATNFDDLRNNKIKFLKKEKFDIFSYPTMLTFEKNTLLENIKINLKDQYKSILDKKNKNNNSIEIIILHFNDQPLCPFCRKAYKDSKYCILEDNILNNKFSVFDLNNKNGDILIVLGANCKNYFVEKKFNVKNNLFINPSKDTKKEKNYISIFDCLEKFREEKNIENENDFCQKCNINTQSTQKRQIFKTPLYLIINLKNENKKDESIENKKNNTKVYITETLDLKEYVNSIDKDNSIYELYGSILYTKGHYAAYCKKKEKWVFYDDGNASISTFQENKKYNLLFYKKKTNK